MPLMTTKLKVLPGSAAWTEREVDRGGGGGGRGRWGAVARWRDRDGGGGDLKIVR